MCIQDFRANTNAPISSDISGYFDHFIAPLSVVDWNMITINHNHKGGAMENLYVEKCGDNLEGYILSCGAKKYKIITFNMERVHVYAAEQCMQISKTGKGWLPWEMKRYSRAA